MAEVTTKRKPETGTAPIDARAQRTLDETRMVKEAVTDAIDEHRRLGHPIVIIRSGKVLWLKPGEY